MCVFTNGAVEALHDVIYDLMGDLDDAIEACTDGDANLLSLPCSADHPCATHLKAQYILGDMDEQASRLASLR